MQAAQAAMMFLGLVSRFCAVHKLFKYRPYAIDVITQITKRETGGGRKFGNYAAILSGKNGRGLRSLSTAEHFASSRLTSAGNDFAFTPRMHKISTGPNTH